MSFPELKDGCLLVNYLGNTPVEYTVDTVPCDPIYKRYTDGSCMKRFLFIFGSREYYSADINQGIENQSFYEKFSDWICSQNDAGILPDLSEGREPVSLKILTGGYVLSADENTARYQIQLQLIYEEC